MTGLGQFLTTFNAFIEDTCVVLTTAYLISRFGPVAYLVDAFPAHTKLPRKVIWGSGTVFGLLASTEVLFSGMRSPYVFHSLIVCLAMFLGDWPVAGVAMVIVAAVAFAMTPAVTAAYIVLTLLVVAVVSSWVKRFGPYLFVSLAVALTGIVSQTAAIFSRRLIIKLLGVAPAVDLHLSSIAANAFGLFLIMLVLREAQIRAATQRMRIELEQSRVLLVSADLAALRARMRPHFLFNTLSAVAALCSIDPVKAESSVLSLGRLIRRNLDVDTTTMAPLSGELDYVHHYLDIQKLRFGERVCLDFELDPAAAATRLPVFSLQTLIENAFEHGFPGRSGPWRIRVTAHRHPRFMVISVQDNGAGIESSKLSEIVDRSEQPRHGLGIIDRQLRLQFGERGRIRIFSELDRGTLIAFRIPRTDFAEAEAEG